MTQKNRKIVILSVVLILFLFNSSSISILAKEQEYKTFDEIGGSFSEENINYSKDELRSIAEFEPVQQLLLSWPKWWSKTDGYIQEPYFINITRAAQEYIKVNIIVNNNFFKNRVISKLKENQIPLDNITFSIITTNSIWIRDYGPFFIEKNNNLESVDFHRYPHHYPYLFHRIIDDFFPMFYGIKHCINNCFIGNFFLTIQGGNYMTDGQGVGFVGDRIFDVDNPYLSKNRVINRLKSFLGLNDVIVLQSEIMDKKEGSLSTGHIDMFAKLLDENTILVGSYKDKTDVNYVILEDNALLLESKGYNVIRIPMLRDPNNKYNTWTYVNSLIINNGYKKAVLVPQYNIPEDTEAISIYAQAMPDYDIVGIDSSTIIKSVGAIHCTSLTVPIYTS